MAAACSNDGGPTEPASQFTTIQLNVAAAPVYLSLGSTATISAVNDPATSSAWDLGFTATPTVSVNGGASGPAGVKAYCLCANRNLSLDQVKALAPTAGADAFGAATAASIPADLSFQLDAATQAISGWYDYNASTHVVSANSTVWALRLASTAGAYAKFHVRAIPSPGQSNAGAVTLEWATQANGSGTLGADKTLTVDLSANAKVYVNLSTGSTTTAAGTWDVALQGYTIYVNGGASGTGGAAAIQIAPSPYANYAAITANMPIGATGIPTSVFVADGAGGAFLADEPYRYDGTLHQVYPTYDVYLVKRGTAVYKVQVIGYYAASATFGTITVRYAKLTD